MAESEASWGIDGEIEEARGEEIESEEVVAWKKKGEIKSEKSKEGCGGSGKLKTGS